MNIPKINKPTEPNDTWRLETYSSAKKVERLIKKHGISKDKSFINGIKQFSLKELPPTSIEQFKLQWDGKELVSEDLFLIGKESNQKSVVEFLITSGHKFVIDSDKVMKSLNQSGKKTIASLVVENATFQIEKLEHLNIVMYQLSTVGIQQAQKGIFKTNNQVFLEKNPYVKKLQNNTNDII